MEYPHYLLIILNIIRKEKGKDKKNTKKISIEKNISIKREEEEKVKYEFESSIIHDGYSANSGHYYCVKQNNDIVIELDDKDVNQIPLKPNDDS